MATANVSEKKDKTAFVIMPFSPTATEKNWTEVFEVVFRPAVEECGFVCKRAEASTGSLIVSVVESLVESDLVIADVTDRNANVFYELGVRHSLRRGTIIVSQGSEHVPSDLRGYWYLNYGLRPGEVLKFKSEIRRIVGAIRDSPDRSDNPVSDYLDRENISSSRQINRDNLKKLGALLTELSGNRLALQHEDQASSPQLLSTGCLKLLIQTLYLDVGPALLKACYELEYKLELIRMGAGGPAIVDSAVAETDTLYERISDVRQRIAKGEFTEPTQVSMMIWSPEPVIRWEDGRYNPIASCRAPSRHCAKCDGTGAITCLVCGGGARNCSACGGLGEISCPVCSGPRGA